MEAPEACAPWPQGARAAGRPTASALGSAPAGLCSTRCGPDATLLTLVCSALLLPSGGTPCQAQPSACAGAWAFKEGAAERRTYEVDGLANCVCLMILRASAVGQQAPHQLVRLRDGHRCSVQRRISICEPDRDLQQRRAAGRDTARAKPLTRGLPAAWLQLPLLLTPLLSSQASAR